MKYLIGCFLFLPAFLAAQCYGSFEVFGAAGLSNVQRVGEFALQDDPVFVNRFGFGASFRIGERTYLRTSAQFSEYGSQLTSSNLRWGTQHNGNGGFDPEITPPEDLPVSLQFQDYHLYVEGMLALRYQFKTWSNWQPFVEGGFAVGKYGTTTSVHRETDLAGQTTESRTSWADNNYRPVALIGRFGAGTNYNFNERVGLYAMVVGQRHLNDFARPNTIKLFPWQATLEVGVRVFVDPR